MKWNEESVFAEALAKANPDERAAFLDQACADEPALRDSVESLLAAYDAGSFLETPAVERPGEDRNDQTPASVTQAEPAMDGDEGVSLEFLAPSAQPDVLGRLGHYDVLEVIGRGGMGIVLRALDEKLHRVVAIKVMAAEVATNATARKRFAREAQAAAAVTHDHIVTIHAVEEANGLPYLVMQYVSGMSLQERLDRTGPLEVREIVRIGMQTAAGLAAAHAHGMIHRDIKPANILLENGVERVKITDFGLARAVADASLTHSGVVAGTPRYMSPEQARGEGVDQRTDLFSLGSVLYATCTGRPPFRADSSMAVLKRVCDDTPSAIRDTNPEIPDWLVAIVNKLHAKDPAERFQSAAEVAELLKDNLAHLQHPSVVGPVVDKLSAFSAREAEGEATICQPAPRWRRWALAAAALLLCLVGGMGFTEATGVTNVRATVIRVFTPDGTLVVETDDPGIKVTIEGDGGLVITGAGLEEIRLRPDSYKVRATKDGKRVPLERELVSIAKGGREVVRVKLEVPPVPAAANAETGAFVLLAAGKERKFETLAEAVQGASDGDTVEVRGNGPFVSASINLGRTALTIRAGEGFRPVITLDAQDRDGRVGPGDRNNSGLLVSRAPLVLQGLEFRRVFQDPPKDGTWRVIIYSYAPLYVANCRFVSTQIHNCISAVSPVCELRNCEFLGPDGTTLIWSARQSGARLVITNCLNSGGQILMGYDPDIRDIHLRHNTCVTAGGSLSLTLDLDNRQPVPNVGGQSKLLRVEASGNVFDASLVCLRLASYNVVSSGEGKAFLTERTGWQGQENLYALAGDYLHRSGKGLEPATPIKSLADWMQFWGSAEAGSIEGRVRYQGGDLLAKLRAAPEKLTPDDFRLRPDSAGYRAGKDGKDLGADVDLVGPGPAYERWTKTPGYQQWLRDTKQKTKAAPKAAPKAESQAFVLQGGKGVGERTFDTLANAVLAASDGDTIEVRGDGPFVTEPINVGKTALTIRAGAGFRPVIRSSAEDVSHSLLDTNGSLVLEGLELQRLVQDPTKDASTVREIIFTSAPLYLVNCRLLSERIQTCIRLRSSICELHNCAIVGEAIFWQPPQPNSRLLISNCLHTGGEIIVMFQSPDARESALIQLAGNTSCTPHGLLRFSYSPWQPLPKAPEGAKLLRVEASGNIFDGANRVFGWLFDGVPGDEAQAFVAKRVSWKGQSNLFVPGGTLLGSRKEGEGLQPAKLVKSLGDWKQFWQSAETESIEGHTRYQGGNLPARLTMARDNLTPTDLRLRPDSAGYKAGTDGKDLGADIDLVGPGRAYERWKQTPAYQQWRKAMAHVQKAAERNAFVLLGGKGVVERKLDTLDAAILAASDGDTIEVRGNGPFVTNLIDLEVGSLTIRAADGFLPVIRPSLRPTVGSAPNKYLVSKGALVIEGLDFWFTPPLTGEKGAQFHFLRPTGSSLHVTNCRFRSDSGASLRVCLGVASPLAVVRNCEFSGAANIAMNMRVPPCKRLVVDNCLYAGVIAIQLDYVEPQDDVEVRLSCNTMLAPIFLGASVGLKDVTAKPIHVEASGNVFDTRWVIQANLSAIELDPLREPESLVRRMLTWRGRENVYAVGASAFWRADRNLQCGPQNLADWQNFWNPSDADSREGSVRYHGGNLNAKLAAAPATLTPEDFRQRPDSAGYRAGTNGKDLGADVDLVGPGPAYGRWRKTPAYQQWLKDSGQVKK